MPTDEPVPGFAVMDAAHTTTGLTPDRRDGPRSEPALEGPDTTPDRLTEADALIKIADELDRVAESHVTDPIIVASLGVDSSWLRRIAADLRAALADRPEPGELDAERHGGHPPDRYAYAGCPGCDDEEALGRVVGEACDLEGHITADASRQQAVNVGRSFAALAAALREAR